MADRPSSAARIGGAIAAAILLVALQACQSVAQLGREPCWEDIPWGGDGPRPSYVPATVVGTITADMHDPKDIGIWLTTPDGERVDFGFVGDGFRYSVGPGNDGAVYSPHFGWEIARAGDRVELWGGMTEHGTLAVCEIDGQRYTAPPDHNV